MAGRALSIQQRLGQADIKTKRIKRRTFSQKAATFPRIKSKAESITNNAIQAGTLLNLSLSA